MNFITSENILFVGSSQLFNIVFFVTLLSLLEQGDTLRDMHDALRPCCFSLD